MVPGYSDGYSNVEGSPGGWIARSKVKERSCYLGAEGQDRPGAILESEKRGSFGNPKEWTAEPKSSSQKHNKKGTTKIAPGEVTMRNPEEEDRADHIGEPPFGASGSRSQRAFPLLCRPHVVLRLSSRQRNKPDSCLANGAASCVVQGAPPTAEWQQAAVRFDPSPQETSMTVPPSANAGRTLRPRQNGRPVVHDQANGSKTVKGAEEPKLRLQEPARLLKPEGPGMDAVWLAKRFTLARASLLLIVHHKPHAPGARRLSVADTATGTRKAILHRIAIVRTVPDTPPRR
ncbi:hypothetical protein PMIN01_04539 [Paraphaeosphaeria minitans]|uniref:Uncharacterized protein n=1 Tax=Paraphaeosphaeria minitans TaxID=565426 RepID=A0A9P6GLW2_9PLEO|nr:hypothetical protein PMIN01_04539 [Paraphaeosphaeria minitans]